MWNPFARPQSETSLHLQSIGSIPPPSRDVDDIKPLRTASSEAAHRAAAAAPAAQPAPGLKLAAQKNTGGPIAEVEVIGQIAVATFTETELCQDSGAERLAELLVELAETGALHFVLDVQNVQFMDSACIGCLVEALNRLAVRGGRIALVNPNHSVHYVFKLTRLDRVFVICHDVPHALKAVERPRPE